MSAQNAIEHLKQLQKAGIGYKAAADAAGLARSTVAKLLSGERNQLRRHNEARLLAVDATAVSDGALISAKPTWKLLNQLLEDGYSKQLLAKWLGSTAKTPALQIRQGLIKASTALRVRKLYDAIRAGKLRRP